MRTQESSTSGCGGHTPPHSRVPSSAVTAPCRASDHRRDAPVLRDHRPAPDRDQPRGADQHRASERFSPAFLRFRSAVATSVDSTDWTLTASGPSCAATRAVLTARQEYPRREEELQRRRAADDAQAARSRLPARIRAVEAASRRGSADSQRQSSKPVRSAAEIESAAHKCAQARGPRLALIEAVGRGGPRSGLEVFPRRVPLTRGRNVRYTHEKAAKEVTSLEGTSHSAAQPLFNGQLR